MEATRISIRIALWLCIIVYCISICSAAKGSRKNKNVTTTAAPTMDTTTIAPTRITMKKPQPVPPSPAKEKGVPVKAPKGGRRNKDRNSTNSRSVRQVVMFPGGVNFPGVGAGTALSTGTALQGLTTSNGQTITNPFGGSSSFANGMSSGLLPSSTSIANSNSQGMGPFLGAGLLGRKKRQAYGFPAPFGFQGVGSGTALSTGNALQGLTTSNGQTFTSPFGNSNSFANGMSTGLSPSSTSIANSNSQGTNPFFGAGLGRKKRQAFGYPAAFGFPGAGIGSGTALSTGNALQGLTTSNGQTFTNPFGGSNSFANGMSTGLSPSSTSIANSNSQGTNPFFGAGFGRKKRQAFGYPTAFGFPGAGIGSGTALSTGSALQGLTTSNGQTFTSPFGGSNSFANGMSSGLMPTTTSIANSNSQGMGPFLGAGFVGRKKRQTFGFPTTFGFPGIGTGSGTALSTGSALQGLTTSNGQTFTDPFGNSRSLANGMSTGLSPSTTSIANSNSQGTSFPLMSLGRRKRAANTPPFAFGPNDTFNHFHANNKSVVKSNLKGLEHSARADEPEASATNKDSLHVQNSDHEMIADEHLDTQREREYRSYPYGYVLVPMSYSAFPLSSYGGFGYVPSIPYNYYTTPIQQNNPTAAVGRAITPSTFTPPVASPFGAPAADAGLSNSRFSSPLDNFSLQNVVQPTLNRLFVNDAPTSDGSPPTSRSSSPFNNFSLQNIAQPAFSRLFASDGPIASAFKQAEASMKSGRGNVSGSVSSSSNHPDGTITQKQFDFGFPSTFCNSTTSKCRGGGSMDGMMNDMALANTTMMAATTMTTVTTPMTEVMMNVTMATLGITTLAFTVMQNSTESTLMVGSAKS